MELRGSVDFYPFVSGEEKLSAFRRAASLAEEQLAASAAAQSNMEKTGCE
jgi:hypothetical protein